MFGRNAKQPKPAQEFDADAYFAAREKIVEISDTVAREYAAGKRDNPAEWGDWIDSQIDYLKRHSPEPPF